MWLPFPIPPTEATRSTGEPDTGRTLGKFGIMAADYLKENYYSRYRSLIRFGRLTEVLSKVEEEANRLLEQIMEKYLKSETHNVIR